MPGQQNSTELENRPPIVVRFATWVGRTVGRWQRRLVAKKDDAYVMRWKTAWTAGRDACLAGTPRDAVPYRRREQRDAWLAGWLWADTHADHDDANPRRNFIRPQR